MVFVGSSGYYLGPSLLMAFAMESSAIGACVISSNSSEMLPIDYQFNEDGFTLNGQPMGQSNHLGWIAYYID